MKISVLINTFNEERNIRNCLESVKWADEIVIVDMYSDDKTVDIAREYTENIFFFERMGYADPARQFALEKASHDWILVVDADELVPLKLKNRLMEIAENDQCDVVYIPRNNYFSGKLINGMGWGKDTQSRFFKKGYLNFGEKIHDFFNINEKARIYHIKDREEGFIHLTYLDIEQYLDRMNKYSTIEANNIFEGKKERSSLFKNLLLIFARTIKELILFKFNKDGFRGLSIGILSINYDLNAYIKLKLMEEYKSKETRQKVTDIYQKIVDETINDYQNH